MSGGFHSIKTESEHRLRAREAFDPQAHRRETLSAWQFARRKRTRTLWAGGAAAVFVFAVFAAREPSAAWRAERTDTDRREAEARVEARRLLLASDAAFQRESIVSDGRAAIVVNSDMAAPLIAPLEEPFREYAGRTYARQLLRHSVVAQFLQSCGRDALRKTYLERNTSVRTAQESYRARAEAKPLPPAGVPSTMGPSRCGEVAGMTEAGHFDLRLD